ncbi:MAG: hypothetical protein OHK93_004428 [Ramalina farinacea]|uniref:Uncharacterized protein n=1 Tax=Ramalina farinacea TaxID=258253 RepID=A0AA43TV16_9LECA|nr:hypothetical protein [Ramalina farinacea]
MAPQKPSQAAPSRQSRRIHYQSAEVAEKQRVHKHAKNVKRRDRKKHNKARGEDALRRLQAGVPIAAHPHAALSKQAAAGAAPSTRVATTSTEDQSPATVNAAPSERETTRVNARANNTVGRFVDEMWGWVPVVACAAMFYAHLCADPETKLIGLRG